MAVAAATALLALLLLANVTVMGAVAAAAQVRASRQVDHQLQLLGPGPLAVRWNGFDGNRARLSAAGVSHQAIGRRGPLPCAHPVRLVRSLAELCPAPGAPLLGVHRP